VLFGALIQHQLVQQLTLGLALRYVLDALRKPVQDKMHRFGTFALQQFMGRLHEWPKYCTHILQIPHLRQNRELTSQIQAAMGVEQRRHTSASEK